MVVTHRNLLCQALVLSHTHSSGVAAAVQVDEVNIPIVSGGAVSMAQSPLRLLTTQTQQVGTPPVMSNSANSSANNSAMGESICCQLLTATSCL